VCVCVGGCAPAVGARERVRPAKMNFFTDLALDKIFASELVGDEYECR
jgi:hypothetical protein